MSRREPDPSPNASARGAGTAQLPASCGPRRRPWRGGRSPTATGSTFKESLIFKPAPDQKKPKKKKAQQGTKKFLRVSRAASLKPYDTRKNFFNRDCAFFFFFGFFFFRGLGPLGRWPVGVRSCGGVPWLLSRAVSVSCPSLQSCCVRPAVGWPRGAVSPWGCRSAVPVVRCLVLWRWSAFLLCLPPGCLPVPGVAACRPGPVFVRCAGLRGALRSRCRSARACRLAGRACAPWWPPAPRPPRRPGILLVACPSWLAAEHCRRRAALFGLVAAGPVAVACRCRVAVRWIARPPSALAVRLGARPFGCPAPALSGIPLPVPPRGVPPPPPGVPPPPFPSAKAGFFNRQWLKNTCLY